MEAIETGPETDWEEKKERVPSLIENEMNMLNEIKNTVGSLKLELRP